METGKYIINDYLDELSSKAAVPGGGGVAALSAALGASLASMVCSLTIGKEKYKEYEAEVIEIKQQALELQESFLKFADDDAHAFLPLSKAYSMPRKTDEEKAARSQVMQQALIAAAEVPFNLIKTCTATIEMYEALLTKGSTLAISDVAVGAEMIITAASSALLNVYINTKLFADKQSAAEMNQTAEGLVKEIKERLGNVIEQVKIKVKGS
ncbi:MAG: cyclodeaminase/cyclohydrolase family protein [Oscillospiraceae bacterium]|nr:cyclodeaminase/cyclohydrolase family protein [Oscillospiraceae bacterium]